MTFFLCSRLELRELGKFSTVLLLAIFLSLPLAFSQQPAQPDKSGKDDDYSQWKLSLGSGQATDPTTMVVPPGFKVELLRSSQQDEGSWISLCFDPRGRAIVSRESKGLLRFTFSAAGDAVAKVETVNDTLLECRGLLWAYDSLYVNANNSKGLYRLRGTKGDGTFDEVKLLKATSGNVGHGRNDLVLGPDGMIYSIHGDDVRLPDDYKIEKSPLRNYADDRLLPCEWDNNLFNSYLKMPAGYVARTDKNGESWEVIAGGLRNPYGIDFNGDGEAFTYDADMEWDVGMPWYRPTRVNHLVSGGDYGWRKGTGVWRAWYPDSLSSTHDIGLGSPTAIRFGTKTRFPAKYQRALFICDWAYGKIVAVHLTSRGASYEGKSEVFVSGRPLNVTDVEVGPDGAMYFLTGGRKTQSGLYRVSYVGLTATEPAKEDSAKVVGDTAARKARELRRQLEAFHGREDLAAVNEAWPHLASDDPWIRHAARVAIESQPLSKWQGKALSENDPAIGAAALLALARVAPAEVQEKTVSRLLELPWQSLTEDWKVVVARATNIALARHKDLADSFRQKIAEKVDARYPDPSPLVNQLLCEQLVFLRSENVVKKTFPLFLAAKTQEEKIHYLYCLRLVSQPWTLAERRTYFEWLRQAKHFYGAHFLPKFLSWIKADAVATLTEDEKKQLDNLLEDEKPATADEPQIQRPFVRQWKLDDLAGSLDQVPNKLDVQNGRKAYEAALCHRCHRFGPQGSPVGPDLTQVAKRFGRRDLLLSILAPSHAIDEKYRAVNITTHSGQVLSGQILVEDEKMITLVPSLLSPDNVLKVAKDNIETMTPSLVSPMPAGLLNTFSKTEILDLLWYLESTP